MYTYSLFKFYKSHNFKGQQQSIENNKNIKFLIVLCSNVKTRTV